ncbi:MAG TPA: glycosyl transferase [Burkholderiales bacterium]|nr:glycosyl transferase [Burkholderiales bacterium]
MNALVPFALSAAVCALLLWLLLRYAGARLPLDLPNSRSLHAQPVPRVGGVGVLAALAVAAAAGFVPFGLLLALAFALGAVSFVDDLHRLPTGVRLAAHLAASAAIVWYILSPMQLLELSLIILGVAWITNLYNFMDGSDGLAGGMSIAGFGAYAIAASLTGDGPIALTAAAIVGASAAFLAFNFPPARIFLGDVGSIPLGFLAGALGVIGWRNDDWPLWFPLLAFAPFIGDATLTLLKRLLRRERVWHAHREHYYQRMVRMGLGHRRTALIAYALMATCVAAALYARAEGPDLQTAVFALVTTLLVAVALWVDFRWARFCRAAGSPT